MLLIVAAQGRALAFWGLLGVMLVSDVLDGWLARRLQVTSETGRRLDSAGDYATVLALPLSLWWLWPARVRVEAAWLTVALAAYFAPTVYCFIRWRILPSYHTWGAKIVSVLVSAGLILRFTVGLAWPLHAAVLLLLLVMVEEFLIARTLPGWSGSVPTLWHARRRAAQGCRPTSA
jgi:CDP-diacylglycerol--glycerol-3-phosphate 3-phosphatidyltransferase